MARLITLVCAAVMMGTLALAGCAGTTRQYRAPQVVTGDAEVGRQLIGDYGCGSCHSIPGVADANGLVGPPLTKMGERSFIAGELENNQQNMVRWIVDPQAVEPGTAMPNLGVSQADAEQIAAYLEGL